MNPTQKKATIDNNIKFARLNDLQTLNFKQLEIYKVEYGILELKFPQNIHNEISNIKFDGVNKKKLTQEEENFDRL